MSLNYRNLVKHRYGKKPVIENETLTRLISVLTLIPQCFDDFFILKQKPPECEGVEMMNIFSKLVEEHLGFTEFISEDALLRYNNQARSKANLPLDFIPSDELVLYGQYLLAKDKRIEVTIETIELARKYSKKIAYLLRYEDIGEVSKDDKLKVGGVYPRIKEDRKLWVRPTLTTEYSGLVLQAKVDLITEVHTKSGTTNKIFKIVYIDDIVDFPAYYKEKHLELFAGLIYFLKPVENTIISFAVVDREGKTYNFIVSNPPDINADLQKVNYVMIGGYDLPYEYIKNEITV